MSREPGVNRWQHFRASLARQARGRGVDTIAIFVLAALGITMTLWIFTQQKASLPSWAPIVGEDFEHITADFATAQAVTAGQGQAVVVAGIAIGKVASVDLEDGHAVVGMDIEPKYMELLRTDASMLLRPKTGLNDMTVEVEPGTAKEHLEDGDHIPLSQTEPNINFEAFLSTLDADTRQYLQLLVAGGGQGIGGRGRQLSGAFRRLQPFAHYIADLNEAVAARRRELANVIHNFQLLTTELARHDNDIERFVTSSKDVLGNFANQQQAIQETLIEFPSTLAALQGGLASSNSFTTIARPALLKLIPQAQALGPALKANARLFEETTVPIRDQIRPFTRQIRPVVTHARNGSDDLKKAVSGFGNSLGALNYFFNVLAYKPKDKESFLFYLPWVNHNLNATYNLSDASGPTQRAMVLISCNGSYLAYGFAGANPYISTLLNAANIPAAEELPPIPADPQSPTISCGPGSESE